MSDNSMGSSSTESMRHELNVELEQTRKEIQEIDMLMEQSRSEVEKLVQRNSSISSHLQQLQSQFDSASREDVRTTYDAALESQQRLFVMRGQLERLQSERAHLERRLALQNTIQQMMENRERPKASMSQQGGFPATMEKLETIIQAQEAERQRLSQQMHDGPAQALSNFILQTEIAMRLFDVDQQKAREELSNLKTAATSTFQKVRDFIVELRPMMLDDLGLVPTLKRFVESYKEQAKADIRLSVSGTEQRFEPYLEVLVFRSVQELIGNALRHGLATQVKIMLDIAESTINISVEDNGRSFDEETITERGGVGVKLIKDRVEMLGGNFDVESESGQGNRIAFSIPTVRVTRMSR